MVKRRIEWVSIEKGIETIENQLSHQNEKQTTVMSYNDEEKFSTEVNNAQETVEQVYELQIHELDDVKDIWNDVSNRYRVIHKKHGDVYILSILNYRLITRETEAGETLAFFHLHVLNPKAKKWEHLSILAKHTYFVNAISGMEKRGNKFFVLGRYAKKVRPFDAKLKSYVKYLIIPVVDEKLEKQFLSYGFEEISFGEKTTADDLIFND